MHDHLDMPYFGEDERALVFLTLMDIKAVLILLKRETPIAQA